MSSEPDAPLIDPAQYAALVRDASDEQLQAGMEANREMILEEIFRTMPSRLSPRVGGDVSVVAEWRIRGRPDGGVDRWQVTIRDRSCRVTRDGEAHPDVVFSVGPVDFVRLVTGNAKGPLLFLTGRLKIQGDVLKAATYQTYFAIPEAGS